LQENNNSYRLGERIRYLKDTSGLTDRQILELPDDRFIRSTSIRPNFGFSHDPYWLRVTIDRGAEAGITWYLELRYASMDNIEVFLYRGSQRLSAEQGGDQFKFSRRFLNHRFVHFLLQFPYEGRYTMLIRVSGQDTLELPLYLLSARALTRSTYETNLLQGIYYGILIVMALYNFFLFVFLRDQSYIYYVIYICALIMYQLADHGFGYQYLWPDSPYFQARAVTLTASLTAVAVVAFSLSYLRVRRYSRLLLRGFQAIVVGYVLLAILSFIVEPITALQILTAVFIIVPIYAIFAGAYIYYRGYRPALYYLIAWSGLTASATYYVLSTVGAIPGNSLTAHAVYFGTTLEVVLLSIGLASRINLLKSERDLIELRRKEAVQRNQVIENDLNQARLIQHNLMPRKLPDRSDLIIARRYIPMDKVGGDLYGFIDFNNGDLGIFIADVSGHGISAAMISLMTKHQMDSWAHVIDSPAETIAILNDNILTRTGGNFVTIFYAIIKPDRIIYANAGHPYPLLIKKDSDIVDELKGRGRLLGIYRDIRCHEYEVAFDPGDRLVLYTDGVVEIGVETEVSDEQLHRLLLENRRLNAEQMMVQMMKSLATMNQSRPFVDDVTLVCVDRAKSGDDVRN
ncbi:MAG: SpoIIE family protein phosphatase, partial [Leptospiraceae bacterium]|nr:SpoIIE family protein phosphatase [Leptospiraceae bacterium]